MVCPPCRLAPKPAMRNGPTSSRGAIHPAAVVSRVALIGSFSILHNALRFASTRRRAAGVWRCERAVSTGWTIGVAVHSLPVA